MMQKHRISSKWGGGSAGTSTHAAATGRALPHPNRYRKLKSEPIPRLGSEGRRHTRSDFGGNHMVGALVNLAENLHITNKKKNSRILDISDDS
jgi:hypothetical protein